MKQAAKAVNPAQRMILSKTKLDHFGISVCDNDSFFTKWSLVLPIVIAILLGIWLGSRP